VCCCTQLIVPAARSTARYLSPEPKLKHSKHSLLYLWLLAGCGRGYDPIAFGKAGYHATGLDLAETGVASAKQELADTHPAPAGSVNFVCGDFFKHSLKPEHKYDVILDYTFLCALQPEQRPAWAAQMAELLAPGGELVTLIFPIIEKEGGPPFAVSLDTFTQLLTPLGLHAIHLDYLPVELCHPGRDGQNGNPRTALGRWRRQQDA
jgi:methyl halide transferase